VIQKLTVTIICDGGRLLCPERFEFEASLFEPDLETTEKEARAAAAANGWALEGDAIPFDICPWCVARRKRERAEAAP
jgi:hypothetical protein